MSNRVAVITGAGAGVGRASALILAREGFDVVLAGRRREPLEALASDIRRDGVTGLAVPTDVTDPTSVARLFETTVSTFQRLDLLFNNAGISAPPVPFEELTVAQWRAVVDTNFLGSALCAQHAFRVMKQQTPPGGRIINNGSVSAKAPRPNSAPYTATKHAITGLTRSIALDGRRFNIACGQIDIGNAATDMTASAAEGALQANNTIAVEPRIDVAEVARAIAYMASLPLEANVLFMTIMATRMPFVGRG